MKKRGIEPLVGMVIVVGIVIIVSLIVIIFGYDEMDRIIQSEGEKIEIISTEVDIGIYEYSPDCLNNILSVSISNEGKFDISGFVSIIRFVNGEEQILKVNGLNFEQFDQSWFDFNGLDCAYGDIREIEIKPMVVLYGESRVVGKSYRTTSEKENNGTGGGPTCTDVDMDGVGIDDGICIPPFDCNDNNVIIWQYLTGSPDVDGDNYYWDVSELVCSGLSLPLGYSAIIGNDCDDNNVNINPGKNEFCDLIDNNCDSLVDEEDSGVDTSNCGIDKSCYKWICNNGCHEVIDNSDYCNKCPGFKFGFPCICNTGVCVDDPNPN